MLWIKLETYQYFTGIQNEVVENEIKIQWLNKNHLKRDKNSMIEQKIIWREIKIHLLNKKSFEERLNFNNQTKSHLKNKIKPRASIVYKVSLH